MKILILDNYDSFTYNLLQLVQRLTDVNTVQCDVVRNDKIPIEECKRYDKFIFSPGPGLPPEAGILKDLIRAYAGIKSMLGVCLGHQAIAEVFGGSLVNLSTVFHGVTSTITIDKDDYLFNNISKTFEGGRYHSWVVNRENLPEVLESLAFDSNGEIMALRHKTFDIRGVQFHPESIMTPSGETIIKNFLQGID